MKITQIADKNFITNLKISCDEYNNYLNMLKQIKKNGIHNNKIVIGPFPTISNKTIIL